MGLISNYMLGRHLAKLADAFEEVLQAVGDMPYDESEGGFKYLSPTRHAQLRFDLPSRLTALQKHPRHVITQEIIKNGIIARSMGRERRAFAYVNLYSYLLTRDIALDMDIFNESYST